MAARVRSAPLAIVRAAAHGIAMAERLAPRLRLPGAAPIAARELVGGIAGAWLHKDERDALGAALYDAGRRRARQRLAEWERRWFQGALPPAPARLLIGGAGTGREAVALAAAGYRVDALEPAPESAAECRRALGPAASVAEATYEALAASVLDDAPSPAARLASRRYDAVLLGWTSYMHVVAREERARLLLALDRLAPEGPILVTFRLASRARPRGASHRVGRALGARLASRRRPPPAPAGDHERFGVACGFLVGLTEADLVAEARAAGREVRWDGEVDGTARASLWPPASRGG
ncbi:MAG: hypothetical protein IT376_01765 [Polyangiaceae bacterium]|nr:hypothetical protein [Polyangiaceae bacterium]